MYNDLYPKEALEIYLILKLDEKNYDMQDVFYLIYHLSKSQNITDTIYNIKKIFLESKSIYDIENYYLANEQLKGLYFNFSISKYLKDINYKDKYVTAYNKIKRIYINYNLEELINIYNTKKKIYYILDNLSSTNDNRGEFYQLINVISEYTNKNDLQSYCDYFENKNSLLLKIFDFKRGNFKFNQLNQLKNLKNKALSSNNLSKNIFNYNNISKNDKAVIMRYYIKSIALQIIIILFLFFFFHPIEFFKNYITSNNTNLLLPLVVYLIINIFIIISLFINISSIIKIKLNKIKSASNGYISNISTSASTRYNVVTIYFPLYNVHLDTTFKQFSSRNVSIMDKVLVVEIHNKYICIPNNND